jgi:multicomponent Na+:H+ antiporter subunit D
VTAAFALLAVPCVAFGVAPGLFASGLPAGVSTSSVFSTAKLTDAAVITVAGVGAFAAVRRPLARVTAVPDLDALYHPAGALLRDAGSRAVSVAGGVTERTAARAVTAVTAAVSDPDALDRAGIPRTTIGTGVLLVAPVVVLGLVALLWPG